LQARSTRNPNDPEWTKRACSNTNLLVTDHPGEYPSVHPKVNFVSAV